MLVVGQLGGHVDQLGCPACTVSPREMLGSLSTPVALMDTEPEASGWRRAARVLVPVMAVVGAAAVGTGIYTAVSVHRRSQSRSRRRR